MKNLYLSVLAVLALASCSKSELAMRPQEGQVEIKATSQALSIDTRAPFEGTIGADNTLKAYVIMSQTDGDYSTLYGTAGTMTFTDDNITAVGFDDAAQTYPADDSQIYLCALYPETGWGPASTTSELTFDGSQDVMAAEQVSSKKSTASTSVPSFTFKHLLTKLTVNVVAESQAAIDAWGAITEMKLIKADGQDINTTAQVTLKGGSAAFSGAQADNFLNFYTVTDDGATFTDNAVDADPNKITLTEASVLSAYSLVAPITARAQARHFTLSVKTENSGIDPINVDVDLEATAGGAFSGSTQGKAFEITMTFKATQIEATATVTAWEDAGSSEVEIQ